MNVYLGNIVQSFALTALFEQCHYHHHDFFAYGVHGTGYHAHTPRPLSSIALLI